MGSRLMSSIVLRLGSIVLCIISCTGHKVLSQGIGAPSSYFDSPVLHQEASLQKRCALEKYPSSQHANLCLRFVFCFCLFYVFLAPPRGTENLHKANNHM